MSKTIGIDVGGSTTKIVGFDNGKMISPLFVKASDQLASVYGAFGKFTDTNGISYRIFKTCTLRYNLETQRNRALTSLIKSTNIIPASFKTWIILITYLYQTRLSRAVFKHKYSTCYRYSTFYSFFMIMCRQSRISRLSLYIF